MAIDPISLTRAVTAATPIARTGETGGSAFADTLGKLVAGVEKTEAQANTAVSGMLNKTTDVHDAMIALQQSELSLQLVMQIRNKFMQAYQDIMRMPV